MNTYPFPLEPLPYPYDALEPYIDSETMYFHHDKHLKTYVDNLNHLLSNRPDLQTLSLVQLLTYPYNLPPNIKTNLINNAGGVYNHNLFFSIMGGTPKDCDCSPLEKAIKDEFYSFEIFKGYFIETALKQFGSGYAWLVLNCKNQLLIVKTPNQNPPLLHNLKPLLLVDVWEHAYYLKYRNDRKSYVENWFHLINWNAVQDNFSTAIS